MKKILVPLLLTSFLFGPSLALAKKIKVVVSIPYETQAPRSVGAESVTVISKQKYEHGGIFSGGKPDDAVLEQMKATALADVEQKILGKYLASKAGVDIDQRERSKLNAKARDFVHEVSTTYELDTKEHIATFKITGKVNANLMDQFAAYKPTEADLAKVRASANKAVLNAYIAKVSEDSAKANLIDEKRDQLLSMSGKLVSSVSIRDHQVSADKKTVNFKVSGKVNDALFDKSLYGGKKGKKKSKKLKVTALIVARIQDSLTSYDPSLEKSVEANTASMKSSKNAGSDQYEDGQFSEVSTNVKTARAKAVARSNGKSVQKTDEISFREYKAKGLDALFNKGIKNGGYRTSRLSRALNKGGADGELLPTLRSVLVKGWDTIDAGTEDSLYGAMTESGTQIFIVGSMDIDTISKNPQTGGHNARVTVNVNATGYTEECDACNLASEQKYYTGTGASVAEAIDSALETAAKKTASSITAQIKEQEADL